MQTSVTLAALAAAAYAKATAYIDPAVEINDADGDFLMKSKVSGRWDLFENLNFFGQQDMLVTLSQEVFWSAEHQKDVDADGGWLGAFTCFKTTEYLSQDLCWKTSAEKFIGGEWSYDSIFYGGNDIDSYTDGTVWRAPEGKDASRIIDINFDEEGKVSTQRVTDKEFKLFNE